MRPLASRLGALALAVVCAAPLAAQPATGRPCVPELESPTGQTRSTVVTLPSGARNLYQGGGVLYRCQGQNVVIQADSLESYGELQQVIMLGNVRYRDDDVTVRAEIMTWNEIEQWLLARENVRAVTTDGSTLTAPLAEYYRAVPGIRPEQRLTASGRPTLTLAQRDSAGRQRPPVVVVANQITTLADSLVFAGGSVEITRTDAIARGDSATVDEARGFARLMREPSIRGRGERPFTLTGTVIDLFTRERQLERVLSMGDARSQSEGVDLRSDTLDLRLAAGELQSAVAWGPAGATATSPDRDIRADSLEVRMPGQRLQEVIAVGSARIEIDPDSTRIRSGERDWLVGDTVVARFDTATVAGDTARRTPIRELVALVDAQSFQQIAPDTGGVTDRPSLHYVRGRQIAVSFGEDNQPVRVRVLASDTGQTTGLYLDASGATARPDEAGAAPPGGRPSPSARPPAATGATPPRSAPRGTGSRPPR